LADAVDTAMARFMAAHGQYIDGATAVIYAELGFPPPLARGLFCLSRSVGILLGTDRSGWAQQGSDSETLHLDL
jgi:hypothetical protein